jgi:cytochrome c oxidase subunit 3
MRDEPTERLHSHFVSHKQQQDAATLGMWLFLATEVLFFGVLFMGYAYVRWRYPGIVEAASRHLEIVMGSVNTAVLLTSSFIMAAGVLLAEQARHRAAALAVGVTALMGMVFLAIKGTEYATVMGEGFLPSAKEGGDDRLFFWLYFVMTGLHALHVLIGVVLLLILAWLLRKPQGVGLNTVRNAGLYWHFVDLVWVFLFPLLYLAGHRL